MARRTKAGYPKRPLPLPLHSTMFQCLHPNKQRLVCLAFVTGVPCVRGTYHRCSMAPLAPAALGGAPEPQPSLRQAYLVGPAVFYDCQRSGSGKRAQSVSAYRNAGRGGMQSSSCAPVKNGGP